MSFGGYIRQARERRGFSLSEAAKLVGCTKSYLWDIEQDRATNPTIKTLAGLSKAYAVSLSGLAVRAADSRSHLPHVRGSDD
jgi:transcriptional regulator with XRE-family HTH domain